MEWALSWENTPQQILLAVDISISEIVQRLPMSREYAQYINTTIGTRCVLLMKSIAAAARQRLMTGSVVNISFRLPHVSMRLMARRPKTKLTAPTYCQKRLDEDTPGDYIPKPVLKPMALSLLPLVPTKKVSAICQRRPDLLEGPTYSSRKRRR